MSKDSKSTPKKTSGKGKSSKGRKGLWKRILGGTLLLGLFALASLTIHLDSEVREKFSGKRWSIPAKVFARPLELYAGAALSRDDFLYELDALGYRKENKVSGPGELLAGRNQVELHTRGFQFFEGAEPPRHLTVTFEGEQVSSIREAGQGDLPITRLEPLMIGGLYPKDNEDRLLVRLADLPEILPATLIAVEDRRFYEHFGVSPKGIARAVWVNLTSGELVQGGSTLTQQLVKNYFLTSERSLTRKVNEAIMSLLLEVRYGKDEILEAYFNEVFLGQDGKRAIHGFGLGSQYYFGRPLAELRLDQIALLVGLVKGPSYYNPRRQPERALERRNLVLDLLQAQGLASAEQVAAAKARPLDVTRRGNLSLNSNPAFFDMVRRQLRRDYNEDDLTGEGLRVFTSFDPILQRKAEQAVKTTFERLGKSGAEVETAMVVAQPQSGEVQALVGSREAGFAGFNRALDARRPIGSLVKPAVYLTALEQPDQYSLTSIIADEPFTWRTEDGKDWTPQNYDHQAYGTIPLFQALAHSYNLSTARLGLDMGVGKVLQTVRRLGVELDWPDYPAMLLGAGQLSPLQVAEVYQTLANSGFHSPLRVIRNVIDGDGNPVKGYLYQVEQRFDSGVIYLLQEAMHRVMTDGTGRRATARLPGLWLAGKTGTSNDLRDSWFAGFGQNLLAVVWMGRDDNGKTALTGASGALQLWTDFMVEAHPQSIERTPPANVVRSWVDLLYGAGTTPGCPGAIEMPYIRGSEPLPGPPCDTLPTAPTPAQPAQQKPGVSGWLRGLFQ